MKASWLALLAKMYRGSFEGFFCWGMNPACSSAGAGKVREALLQAEMDGRRRPLRPRDVLVLARPRREPKDVHTEVFLLPACSSVEKEGSISNSEPAGAVALQGDRAAWASRWPMRTYVNELQFRVKSLYQKERRQLPEPIVNLYVGLRRQGRRPAR